MKFKKVTGNNKYCGPYAIAAVTGVSTDMAATAIRHHSGQTRVRGASVLSVSRAFSDFGIRCIAKPEYCRLTFNQYLKASVKDRKSGVVFLVVTTTHYQLVSGRKMTCAILRDVVSIRAKGLGIKRRARVECVYQLEGKPTMPAYPHPCSTKMQAEVKRKRQSIANARYKAMKLAKKYGIGIEADNGFDSGTKYWVDEPKHLTQREDFPSYLDDERCRDDWEDVHERVVELVEYIDSLK